MSLSAAELEAFVADVRERSGGLDSERAVELRVVEPFLERLGWDVRGPAVEPQAEVRGVNVSYVLAVDGVPSILVQTAPPGAALDADRVPGVADALTGAGVDWGLVTDGRTFVLLARSEDGVHRQRHDLEALPDATTALQHYTRETSVQRRARDRTDRAEALERLAERREAAVDAVTGALVDVAGDAIDDPARAGAEHLVDELLDAAPEDPRPGESGGESAPEHAATDPESQGAPSSPATPSESPGPAPQRGATESSHDSGVTGAGSTAGGTQTDGSSNDTAPESDRSSTESSRTARGTSGESRGVPDAPPSRPPPTARSSSGEEYVVRFFGGSASVGAVGTDNPAGTLAGAVEFLLENHDLASTLTLPWGVEDGRAVLARTPEHPDGSTMTYYETIGDRWCVWTGGDEAAIRTAIEELTEKAGLRAMFQGDW